MALLYILMFLIMAFDNFFERKNLSIISFFYINLSIASLYFYIHVTDKLNLSF